MVCGADSHVLRMQGIQATVACVASRPGRPNTVSGSSRESSAKRRQPTKNWHDWELFLEPPDAHERSRAYVCVYPLPRPRVPRSRFVVRLDLPDTYATRSDAECAAADVTHRYFRGTTTLPSFELSARIGDYLVTGTARFRADVHEWEPSLEITAVRGGTNYRQRFAEHESPFYGHTFASRQAAAQFALRYGQRMVLGALPGLRT